MPSGGVRRADCRCAGSCGAIVRKLFRRRIVSTPGPVKVSVLGKRSALMGRLGPREVIPRDCGEDPGPSGAGPRPGNLAPAAPPRRASATPASQMRTATVLPGFLAASATDQGRGRPSLTARTRSRTNTITRAAVCSNQGRGARPPGASSLGYCPLRRQSAWGSRLGVGAGGD